MRGLDLREHLGHKIGTVGDALLAREEISSKVEEIFSGRRDLRLGAGFDSYDECREEAEKKHRERVPYIQKMIEGFGDITFEDGGIKSEESTNRKIGKNHPFQVPQDISRIRIIVPDLQTLFVLSERMCLRLYGSGEYHISRLWNKYTPRKNPQTYYAGTSIIIGDAESHSTNYDPVMAYSSDEKKLEEIRRSAARLIESFEGMGILSGPYFPGEKERLIHLTQRELLERYNNQKGNRLANIDIPTEIQILTRRTRAISEDNRELYSQLSSIQREGVDFSEYNKKMLRATLLDWQEYFAARQK